jgi:hypothetical protein
MSLWGKKDSANSAPKWLNYANTYPAANTSRDYSGLAPNLKKDNAFFVDTTEAAVSTNRAHGIKTPGWNEIFTYTDSSGNTRRRVESMIPMKVSAASAGDQGVIVISAPSIVSGTSYKILSVGNTDFTLIGSANNTVGTVFTASGAGTGTGTVGLAIGDNATVPNS